MIHFHVKISTSYIVGSKIISTKRRKICSVKPLVCIGEKKGEIKLIEIRGE